MQKQENKATWCYLSHPMGKPTICICENKDADQLRVNREADQRHCFRYSDSTIPLLLKSEISSFMLFSVLEQVGLCRTCSETTLLVFPRGGSFYVLSTVTLDIIIRKMFAIPFSILFILSQGRTSKLQYLVPDRLTTCYVVLC